MFVMSAFAVFLADGDDNRDAPLGAGSRDLLADQWPTLSWAT
jgi:hypothetical protein